MSRRSVWALTAACAGLLAARAASPAQSDELVGFERTPPRLSYSDGEASFWRPGAGDWTPARVNTPLAAGDQLYTGDAANLELQIGAGAFVRAGEATQLGLTSLEPDFLQLRVTEGRLSLDLRSRRASQTLEIGTPNAAFTIEHNGYYRVEVDGETTTFTSRRGGRATVTPAAGDSFAIAPSEQVVVTGTDAPGIETWAAPELDAWDRWNYARSDDQMDAVSARYVPAGVSGVDDLDQHGDWRLVPSYGAVWVPRRVATGWVPYSTGRWIYDPYYGWTWVDDAPWGWAPYHYGRWVHVSGFWGWCPGRVVVRPYYAPALVAFFGGGGLSVGISTGAPRVGWVALGWGEPLVPWWGPARFRSAPRWAGWDGPRIVNNVVVKQQTVIQVREINVYQNAHVHHAIVAVDRDHFGRRSHAEAKFSRVGAAKLEPLHGDLRVKPDRTSLVAATGPARRPPREALHRSVVATREPRVDLAPGIQAPSKGRAARARRADPELDLPAPKPPARVVQPTRTGRRIEVSGRPPFGRGGEAERRIPPPAPRFGGSERGEPAEARRERPREHAEKRGKASRAPIPRDAATEPMPRAEAQHEPPSSAPRTEVQRGRIWADRPEREAAPSRRVEAPSAPLELPGEPASRVYRQHPGARHGAIERAPVRQEVREPRDLRPDPSGTGDSQGHPGAQRHQPGGPRPKGDRN